MRKNDLVDLVIERAAATKLLSDAMRKENVGLLFTRPAGLNIRIAAHHIVPVQLFKNPAVGVKLHKLGIDLNGAENGVWLPFDHYNGRTASLHRGNHQGALKAADGTLKDSYVKMIERRFRNVSTREEALQLLEKVRQELLTTQGLLFNEKPYTR